MPAVRSSVQAITLQMAAAKAYGVKDFAKLDPLTVSMTPPDATIALLKGGAQISAALQRTAVPVSAAGRPRRPHRAQFLRRDGRPHTFTAVWTAGQVPRRQSGAVQGLVAALKEATDIVNKDKRAAAALWIENSKSKLPLDMVAKIVAAPQVRWTMVA